MNKKFRVILIFGFVLLFFMGCADKLTSPQSELILTSVNENAPLIYSESNQETSATFAISTVNGVDVSITGYTLSFFHENMTPVSDSTLNRSGAISVYIEGYSEQTVTLEIVTPRIIEYMKGNPESSEDDSEILTARVTFVGVDINENQISITGNVEIVSR